MEEGAISQKERKQLYSSSRDETHRDAASFPSAVIFSFQSWPSLLHLLAAAPSPFLHASAALDKLWFLSPPYWIALCLAAMYIVLSEDPVGRVGSSEGGRRVIRGDGRGSGTAEVGVMLPDAPALGPVGSEGEGAVEMGSREGGSGFLTAEENLVRPASILTAGTRAEADPFDVPPPSSGKSSGGGV